MANPYQSRVEGILEGTYTGRPLSRVEKLLMEGGGGGEGGFTPEEKQKIVKYSGSVNTVEDLPDLSSVASGSSYNVVEGGVTTDDFLEGAGVPISPGSDVYAINLGTIENPILKWNLPGGESEEMKPLTEEQRETLINYI